MLTNKVSPASLLSSEPSAMTDNGADTCNSQVSLFDAPSSVELFSDTAQSQSGGSQGLGGKFFQRPTPQQQPLAKTPLAKINPRHLKVQPEIPLRRMFFDKYLTKSKPQKTAPRCDSSQASKVSQDSTYEEWRSSQRFTLEIEKAVKEGMKEAKDEIKTELKEVRAAIMEHEPGVSKTETLTSQLLASVTELRQCVERCSKETQSSIFSCLESQNAMLSKKLDGLLDNLTGRIEHLETLVSCSSHSTATIVQNTATTQPEPVRRRETSPALNVIANDRTVPSLKDSLNNHQSDPLSYHEDEAKPISLQTDCASTEKSPVGDNSQNDFSTSCDIDLTKESSLVYSQMIARARQKENIPQIKTENNTETRRKGHRARQSPAAVYPTPLATRRRSQRKRAVKPRYRESTESSDGECQPKRRAVQPEQGGATPQVTATTPRAGLDSFFSQTPSVPAISGPVTQPATAQEQCKVSNIFHRSTEAARRRVEVFAGLTSSTSALLEISNVIKKQQDGYSSDDSL